MENENLTGRIIYQGYNIWAKENETWCGWEAIVFKGGKKIYSTSDNEGRLWPDEETAIDAAEFYIDYIANEQTT